MIYTVTFNPAIDYVIKVDNNYAKQYLDRCTMCRDYWQDSG